MGRDIFHPLPLPSLPGDDRGRGLLAMDGRDDLEGGYITFPFGMVGHPTWPRILLLVVPKSLFTQVPSPSLQVA